MKPATAHRSVLLSPRASAQGQDSLADSSAPPSRYGRSLWLFGLLVVSGLSAAGYVHHRRAPLSSSEQAATVASTSFEGIMKPASEFKLAAPTSGAVQGVYVKVGDHMQEGQLLVVLDNREAHQELAAADLEQRTAELQLAKSKVNQEPLGASLAGARTQLVEAQGLVAVLQRRSEQVPTRDWRNSPEQAQAAYDQAMAQYQRAKSMFEAGLISRQDFENYQIALRMAQSELQDARRAETAAEALERAQETEARLQAEVERLEQGQGLKEATLRYEQAARRVAAARRRLDDTLVKATHSGTVVELPVKVGDQVPAGAMLVRLAELRRIVVEVQVAARLINTLHTGQAATVALPTVPVRKVEGTVITINPLPSPNMTHTVEVQFDNQTGELLVGQVAEVYFAQR